MAYYTYKRVVDNIPEYYKDKFEEEHGVEPDGDPNYNGDDWLLVSMWIEDLKKGIVR